MPAARRDRRLAGAVVAISALAFAAMAPFAQVKLARVDAFIPIYQSALTISDVITAVLLFGQFGIARSRSLLVLAGGYAFTALMTISHTLSFPGLFAPTGLLDSGMQTTAWLYMFWHGGFPLAIIGYALLNRSGARIGWSSGGAIAGAFFVALAVAVGLTVLATSGKSLLPNIMTGNSYTPVMIFVVSSVWALSCLALVVLWLRRPHSVLDVWLMVVMCAWLFDIALSAVLNAGRFDLGFYAGRAYGLMAATFVLIVLLSETTVLYARFARSVEVERVLRERRLAEANALLAHVSRLSEMSEMVPAVAHEMNQPLTAIVNYLEAGRVVLESGQQDRVLSLLEKASAQAQRAGQVLHRLRNFMMKEDGDRQAVDLREIVYEAVALTRVVTESASVEISTAIDPAASSVFADSVQVQQVLLNLMRNAIEAMADSPMRKLTIAAAPAAMDRIEISVSDTGPGLAPHVRARLFQPFVSTKDSGMGVGLSICRLIVESHGGTLRLGDNPEGGSVFRFTLMAAPRDSAGTRAGSSAAAE